MRDPQTENAALVALLKTRPEKLTWRKLTDRILDNGSAIDVWHSFHPESLLPSDDDTAALEESAAALSRWEREGLTFLSALDSHFPRQLQHMAKCPPFLFARGELRDDDPAVAVVGSRNVSPRGLALAEQVAESFVAEGFTITSGLAAGVDAAAHKAALRAGGRTVAVIATGLNNSYPAVNRDLQVAIAERGLVLSQFWPDAPPQKANFLQRNALIAAYSLAAVVIEAGENSGARNLARHAVEQGRPLILTDLVIAANEWARQMLSVAGVHRAAGPADVVEVVKRLSAGEDTHGRQPRTH
jgi:DNA processing protein